MGRECEKLMRATRNKERRVKEALIQCFEELIYSIHTVPGSV